MHLIRRVARRARQWWHRDHVEAELDAELRDHLEREIDERVASGMSRDEATRLARRDFGGVEKYKEESRDVLGLRFLDDAWRDVVYACRLLRRSPGFTIAAALTFALGIGCTSAIFALVNGILLRPLPYPRPNELVALWERNLPRAVDRNVVSPQLFDEWRSQTHAFTDVAAMVPAPLTLAGNPAERISGAQVSPSYFRLLGVHPSIGRGFTNADEANGGAPVAILSDALWRSRFAADPAVIGKTLQMDGSSYTVVGVMPRDFDPPQFGWMTEFPLWIPFAPTPANRQWGRFLHVIARLRPGTSLDQARAELISLSERRGRESADSRDWSASIVPLREQITGDVRRPLLTVFGAVVLLLLLSVANVANLVTTFTRRRQHELALRRAIGATGYRLFRQQLMLTLTLGAMATVVGLIVAVVATRGLVALMPADVPRVASTRVDSSVVMLAGTIACLTTIVVGIVSMTRAHAVGRAPLVLSSTRATTRLSGGRLITSEMAIGLVLSALAALMVRSFLKLESVDLGFAPRQVAVARISLPTSKYASDTQWNQFFDALLARTRALPGVTSASIGTPSPFLCCSPATIVSDAARRGDTRAPAPTTDIRFVDSAYFSTLRIAVREGSSFTGLAVPDTAPRAVISRSLARSLWGDAEPIGRRISIVLFGTTTAEVIGVVGDVHRGDARTPPRPAAYLDARRFPNNERDLMVRSSGDVGALVASLRGVLASLDRSVPLYRARPLESTVRETLARDRLVMALLTAFAVLALMLAAVGVHGVLSSEVTRRRKEIGVRIALGANRESIYRFVLGRALPAAGRGILIGLVAALLLSRAMAALVFGIDTTDPLSFLAVVGLLSLVGVIAAWIPAFRATRVSPLEAIRAD